MKSLCVMLDTNFMIGFRVFWKSFIIHNQWFLNSSWNLTVIDVGLTEQDRAEIFLKYGSTIFKKPCKANYNGVNFNKTDDKLKNTYYTLDIFNYGECERIVFLDVDMLVLGDLKELFNCEADIAGVRCYDYIKDSLRNDFNAGVFVINKPLINITNYVELIDIARKGFSMPEQKTMNIYFKDKIHFLPKIYNVEKRMLHTKRFKKELSDAKIIHFVACKPWESKEGHRHLEQTYVSLEDKWWKYKNMEEPLNGAN